MRLRCPHCNTPGTIRTSEMVSSTVSRHYIICNNFECGHAWRATTEADMTLSPSATPASTVVLPLSSHVRRDVIAAQLRSPASVEHLARQTPPVTMDLFGLEPRTG